MHDTAGDEPSASRASGGTARWLPPCLSIAALGYTAALHHGLGAPPGGLATEWWQPTGFLREMEPIASWAEAPAERGRRRAAAADGESAGPAWALVSGVGVGTSWKLTGT